MTISPALGGVALGSAAALAGTSLQLWSNAHQRERDRKMQLKRDVYFEATDGLAALLEYLQQSSRSDTAFGKADMSLIRQGWLLKAFLVANTDTLISMNEASASMASAILELIPLRLEVPQIDDDITVVRATLERIQQAQDEHEREL